VAYLLKAWIVKPQKKPFLGNGCVICNRGVITGSGIFCVVGAEAI
jgi:hypothetical protein